MRSIDLPTHAKAQRLRGDASEAEKRVCRRLRNRALAGHKFPRQFPIGSYFAGFACRERKLVVEIDGATHSRDVEIARDLRRAACLRENGYRPLRISNADVCESMEGVPDLILATLESRRADLRQRLRGCAAGSRDHTPNVSFTARSPS